MRSPRARRGQGAGIGRRALDTAVRTRAGVGTTPRGDELTADEPPGSCGDDGIANQGTTRSRRSTRSCHREAPGTLRRSGGVAGATVAIGLYLLLAVVLFWKVWSGGPASVSELGGDQYAFMWLLEWTPFALTHGHSPFFSNYANYPLGVNLLTNTGIQLLGLLASPITWLWGSVASFNLLMTLAMPASATAGYFLALRWVSWRPAAFIGGLLYGFSPYEIGQSAGHLDLTFIVLPPLVLLVVHEICVVQRRSERLMGVLLGLLITAQFFISSEIMTSTLIITGIFLFTTCITERELLVDRLRRVLTGLAWGAVTATILLAYPVWFVLRGPAHISGPIQLVPQGYRADLAGLVVPDSLFRFAPAGLAKIADSFSNGTTENGSYLGITLLLTIVVGAGVLWRRSSIVRVGAITCVAAIVLSLGSGLVVKGNPPAAGTGIPLPERLLTKLPLLSNAIPARYGLYAGLFAALVLALILDHLHTHLATRCTHRSAASTDRRGWKRARKDLTRLATPLLPLALASLALLPLVPKSMFPAAPVGTPAFFSSAALQRVSEGTTALIYPYTTAVAPNSQQWQAASHMRFRMPDAYFLLPQSATNTSIVFNPDLGYTHDTLTARVLIALYDGQPPAETPQLRSSLLTQFHQWRVRTFIAFPTLGADPAGCIGFLTWLLGKAPTNEPGLAEVWFAIPLG